MKKKEAALLKAGFAGYVTANLINSDPQKDEEYKELLHYQLQWKNKTDQFQNRKKELEKYKLDDTVDLLNGETKDIFSEAINCYLFGLDFAASNMICLVIEMYLREKTKNNKDTLYDLIQNLVDTHEIEPVYLTYFHALRKQRNIQVHTINKLDELTILGMIKTMKDITQIFYFEKTEKLD